MCAVRAQRLADFGTGPIVPMLKLCAMALPDNARCITGRGPTAIVRGTRLLVVGVDGYDGLLCREIWLRIDGVRGRGYELTFRPFVACERLLLGTAVAVCTPWDGKSTLIVRSSLSQRSGHSGSTRASYLLLSETLSMAHGYVR